MEAKTKAQELGFLSREYAVGKDKAKWLSLFAENAVVQDPIGVSPLDPSGEGHKGLEAIENQGKFFKTKDGELETPLVKNKECAYVVFNSNGTNSCGIENA